MNFVIEFFIYFFFQLSVFVKAVLNHAPAASPRPSSCRTLGSQVAARAGATPPPPSHRNLQAPRLARSIVGPQMVKLIDRSSEYTVEPACKVLGFVQQKLTIQEGFCCLTLQPSIIIKNMVIWDLLELTLHPF